MVVVAQSTNNEQRLVGAWTSMLDGSVTVFNSNGSFTGSGALNFTGRYAAAGDKIAIFDTDSEEAMIFHISNDGRTLIVVMGDMGGLKVGYVFRRNT